MKYSFDHLAPATQGLLPALSLFEGVVDEDLLAEFSKVETGPKRFAGVIREG